MVSIHLIFSNWMLTINLTTKKQWLKIQSLLFVIFAIDSYKRKTLIWKIQKTLAIKL